MKLFKVLAVALGLLSVPVTVNAQEPCQNLDFLFKQTQMYGHPSPVIVNMDFAGTFVDLYNKTPPLTNTLSVLNVKEMYKTNFDDRRGRGNITVVFFMDKNGCSNSSLAIWTRDYTKIINDPTQRGV